ncbi:LacI family DNA-binding transcriptional regulator [Vibrio vulnificus]|uniref:LacI family DNA-binding transcriptional regulator n=1 Tax=Vibrio vulnificus TaxID=672 RepID=UPI001FAED5D3|nr:LacI family DNA-binding transcriptional regulator [Vibrio vulnificus]MCJ0813679.1 LacI family DNA-binding transcriptional regulator [Vibrio vulnificus]MCR9703222.1 LacI family DNA-binding transcriptional regulator [Vibrio vulnificus]
MSEPRKRRSTGSVTLADVAKKAGVGTMTVSRALRTPELVSDKLRDKIQQVVDELGYIPNKAAGALASAESYSIALILPSLVEKSCALFLPSFQHTLNKAGYQLLLGYSDYSAEQEEKLLSAFLEDRPAGVVLFGSSHSDRTHQLLHSANTQVLEIAELSSEPRYMNIGVDHFDVGKVCTKHLVEQGFRNIGFIGARGNHSTLQRKLHGWQSAMIENYLTPDHFLTTHEAPSAQLGAEGLAKLLLRDSTLDALVCSNEEIAIGALFECHRRVIKVPGDMAIICLEGSTLAEHAYPSISSAEYDYDNMGTRAAEKLLHAIKGERFQEVTDLGFRLKRRASTQVKA